MVAIGQLLSTLNLNVVCSQVAAETSVEYYLLLEDTEFLKEARKANSLEELCDWVNENY